MSQRMPPSEAERLEALSHYKILDTPPEKEFDDLVYLASQICGTPVALVTLLDESRQWFKAQIGLDQLGVNITETPREVAFCHHAIRQTEMLTVQDAREDERFTNNPLVTGNPHIRFYAGAQLVTPEGQSLGTLCVIDQKPRELTPSQEEALRVLARQVTTQLEMRRALLELDKQRRELEASRKFRQATIDALSKHIAIIDDQGIIVQVNAAWRNFGRDNGIGDVETVGCNYLAVCRNAGGPDSEHAHEAAEGIQRVLDGEMHQFRMEYPCPVRTERRWFAMSVTRFTLEDQNFAVISHEDITERYRAAMEVRDSQQLLQSVLDQSPTAIAMKDAEGNYLLVNREWERITAYSREQVNGKSVFEALHPDVAKHVWENDQKVLQSRIPLQTEEFWTNEAGARTYLCNRFPLLDDNGNPRMICNFYIDISDRKETENAVQMAMRDAQAARAEAERANKAKSEFLSRMSHELRTPLNAILGFGQILQIQNLTERQSENVSHILHGGQHLLSLINEVLDLARVESGYLEISEENIKLAEVVAEATTMVRPLAEQQGIRMEVQPLPQVGLTVQADRQRLRQVLINLLSNAIKYNRETGEVFVTFDVSAPDTIGISVRDTGWGIAEDYLPKLFTPFERLAAKASTIEGTGLGLALSRALIEAMRGSISVESKLYKGSTFTIRLPRADTPAFTVQSNGSAGNDSLRDDAANDERPCTILLVEDNESNLMLMRAILERRPHVTLVEAHNGFAGLESARNHHPDLVLLDLDLPDISGRQVLSQLKVDPATAHIPVVVVSADATPHMMEELMQSGAQAYISKPVQVQDVWALVDSIGK